MLRELPSYLREKYQVTGTVLFTAFFSLLFLVLSTPYSRNSWFDFDGLEGFGYTMAYYASTIAVMVISKSTLYLTRDLFKINYLHYILWCLGEILICSFIYVGFTVWGDSHGIISSGGLNMWKMFSGAFLYSFSCIAIPTLLSAMYFAIVDMNKTIRLMSPQEIVSDDIEASSSHTRKVTLYDNSGMMKLSVSLDNLYLIESDDNYVIVSYTDNAGEMKKYMIRCRLKTIEQSFKGSSLIRCHRGYIVNIDKVKVLRKEKDGWELDFLNESIRPIAVSKTYAPAILARFESQQTA